MIRTEYIVVIEAIQILVQLPFLSKNSTMESSTVNSEAITCSDDKHSRYIFFDIMGTPLIALSMLLNGGILLFIVGSQRLRKQHNIFTFNMALIDFTSAVAALLFIFERSWVSLMITIDRVWNHVFFRYPKHYLDP